ncbi:MAG TPA: hypothetical protein VNK82_13060 [Terriglobales bacterium]|nr:hypothetical protein [Terriglobales bacterium]
MRTTLTLEPDVAAKLKAEVRRTGHSFKQVVNDMLRKALCAPSPGSARPPKPFPILARPLGLKPGLSYDNIGKLLEEIEGPFHK